MGGKYRMQKGEPAQKMTREELAHQFDANVRKLTLVTELAVLLRVNKAPAQEVAHVMLAISHAVDNKGPEFWNHSTWTLARWLDVFRIYKIPAISGQGLSSLASSAAVCMAEEGL
jgi:hypothetical protein